MEISCRVYKPRRARESPLFRLVEQHLEELLRVWPKRFARQHGPLRPVVERVLRGFMPRLLRGIFRKRRELLLDLAQCAAEAVAEYVRRGVGADARPGVVASIATSGALWAFVLRRWSGSRDSLQPPMAGFYTRRKGMALLVTSVQMTLRRAVAAVGVGCPS